MGEAANEEFLLSGYKGTVKWDENTSETYTSILSSCDTFHDHIFNAIDISIDPSISSIQLFPNTLLQYQASSSLYF